MTTSQDDNFFPAKMMTRQFRALKDYISRTDILNDLRQTIQNNIFRKDSNYNKSETKKWLMNGWNTEKILIMSKDFFDNPENSYAIQWTFPQAYYSCYCISLGFFKTAGFTENRHSTVVKKIGCLIREGKYPNFLTFYADGGMYQITLNGVSRAAGTSSIEYIPHCNTPFVLLRTGSAR